MLSKNGLQRSNLFAATKNSIPRVEQSGFVFGQNVHERVTGAIVISLAFSHYSKKIKIICILF